MKNIRHEIAVWIQLITFISIWALILLLSNTRLNIDQNALKKLPDVVGIYAILYYIFSKWIWRLPILQGWLIPFPNLQGTWKGTLQTTWKDPKTNKVPSPITLLLVIKQSFDEISCIMHTEESSSISNAALLSQDNNGIICLSYNYTNKPDAAIRERSAVHDGAALLTVISKPERLLKGEYWTNRKTTGSIELSFLTSEIIEDFPKNLKRSKKRR
jgi:hypothetical protein